MAEDEGKTTKTTTEQVEAHTKAVKADTDALGAWEFETAQADRTQKSFLGTLRSEVQEIKNAAKEIGSFKSQITDLSSATQSYLYHLKNQISFSHQYSVLLDEMREGQKNFSKSLLASTNQIGVASAQSQRHIDALHDAYAAATRTAGEYGLEAEELKSHARDLASAFASQLGAMNDQGGALAKLQKDTFLFSKFMGVDLREATELVNDRLQNSTKSLGEVRKEIMVVAREADNWTKKLQSMGAEALRTGNVTREGFLRVIKEIQGEFRGGMFAAEGFARATGGLLEEAKKRGFTPAEAQTMATGFGKFIKDLGSSQNFFGIRTAQVFGNMLRDINSIQDEKLKKRLERYAKKVEAGTELNIIDLQAIAGATAGSSEGIKMLLKEFKTSGMSPDVMRSVMGQAMGPGQQHLADAIVDMVQAGDMEKAFETIDQGNEDQKKQQEEQLDFWKKDLEQLIKEGHTAEKIQYQTIQEIHKMRMKIEAFINQYPMLMMGIMAAAQVGGGLLGKVGGALLGRVGMGAAPAAGSMMGGGGALAGAGAVTAVTGVAVAAVGGIVAGRMLDKWVGEKIAEGDRTMETRMGKQKELSTFLALSFHDALYGSSAIVSHQILDFQGEVSQAQRDQYYQNKKQIEWAEKNWKTLDETKKREISHMKIQNDSMRDLVEKPIDTAALQLNNLMLVQDQEEALTKAWGKIQAQTIGKTLTSQEAMQDYLREFVASAGNKFMMRGDPTQAIAALEKTDFFKQLQLQSGGMAKENITSMLIKAMAERRFATGRTTEAGLTKEQREIRVAARMREVMAGEEGKKFSPELISAVKGLVEARDKAREERANALQLEIVGGTGPEKEATREPGGTVTIPVPQTAVRVSPKAQAMMAAGVQQRGSKRQ